MAQGFLERGRLFPPHQLWDLGSAVSYPSWVRDGAPAAQRFPPCIVQALHSLSRNWLGAKFGGHWPFLKSSCVLPLLPSHRAFTALWLEFISRPAWGRRLSGLDGCFVASCLVSSAPSSVNGLEEHLSSDSCLC